MKIGNINFVFSPETARKLKEKHPSVEIIRLEDIEFRPEKKYVVPVRRDIMPEIMSTLNVGGWIEHRSPNFFALHYDLDEFVEVLTSG